MGRGPEVSADQSQSLQSELVLVLHWSVILVQSPGLVTVNVTEQFLVLCPPEDVQRTVMASPASTRLPLLLLLLSAASTLSSSTEDLTNRNSDFAARLYRVVSSQTDDNVLLSPFSLSAGLMALLSGTAGPTQEQLLQGLSLTGLDPQTLPGKVRGQRWTSVTTGFV